MAPANSRWPRPDSRSPGPSLPAFFEKQEMKDFFDIVVMARMFAFDGDDLVRAIRATFERRGTALPDGLPMGSATSLLSTRTQRSAFLRKAGAAIEMGELADVLTEARRVVGEPLATGHQRLS